MVRGSKIHLAALNGHGERWKTLTVKLLKERMITENLQSGDMAFGGNQVKWIKLAYMNLLYGVHEIGDD